MQLPRRHKDTKVHKEFILNDLFLVQLCALAPWWQKNTFRSGLYFGILYRKIKLLLLDIFHNCKSLINELYK